MKPGEFTGPSKKIISGGLDCYTVESDVNQVARNKVMHNLVGGLEPLWHSIDDEMDEEMGNVPEWFFPPY